MGRPEFGLYPQQLEDNPPDLYWGARAIISDKRLDIPWDRQSFQSTADEETKSDFIAWVNTRVIPYLHMRVKKGGSTGHVEGHNRDDTFRFIAEDRNSGGYLYICAYAYTEGDSEL